MGQDPEILASYLRRNFPERAYYAFAEKEFNYYSFGSTLKSLIVLRPSQHPPRQKYDFDRLKELPVKKQRWRQTPLVLS